jgi:hypothetical protein
MTGKFTLSSTADHHAQDDGADRQALDPPVGLDQLRRRQQLGQDAVLGRRVGRRAEADDGVGHQWVAAEQHHQAADHLDAVGDEHHPALGDRVGKCADEGRQHHIEEGEHRHQCGRLPGRRTVAAQQLDGGDEQCVVGERAEELRRHDGREAFFHRALACATDGYRCDVSGRPLAVSGGLTGARFIARTPLAESPAPCRVRSKR